MNNVNIDGIKDINVVKELFSSVNGLEDDNIFLVVLNRDYVPSSIDPSSTLKTNSTVAGAKIGGVAGGLVGGAIGSSMSAAIEETVNEFYSKLTEQQKAGYYECQKCHHKYIPSYSSVLWAMHINRTRYMKCPKCNQKSWQKKVTK